MVWQALRQISLHCDGFIHAGGTADQFKELIDQIEAFRKEYGREDVPFEYQVVVTDVYDLDVSIVSAQNVNAVGDLGYLDYAGFAARVNDDGTVETLEGPKAQ